MKEKSGQISLSPDAQWGVCTGLCLCRERAGGRRRGAGGRRRELYRVVEICPGAGALRYKSVPSQLYNQRSHDTWEHCAGATLIQTQPAETIRDRETGISIILCMKKFKFEGKIIVFFYRRHFSPLIFITLYIEASLCRAANQQTGACGRMSQE